ncbi:MAG: dihydropteroate synthase [Clostridia bacterium]|nr:dihydropteroate synthase [Clostridia bacterium]
MIIRDRKFEGYTYVMAIINLTPDSFWKGSRVEASDALFAVEKAIRDGAAVIDIGAQSTRPGYTEVSADEEIRRFEEPLRLIRERFDIPISVDTYFEKSARAALDLGADMINDIWGLSHDEGMAKAIADYDAAVCIMHNSLAEVQNLWTEVPAFLQKSAEKALAAGISRDKIILDGGIGFAKTMEQNRELMMNYDRLSSLGYPLLLGTSRKRLFGGNVEDRLPQTVESSMRAAKHGILFVRVHDVKENAEGIEKAYGYSIHSRS